MHQWLEIPTDYHSFLKHSKSQFSVISKCVASMNYLTGPTLYALLDSQGIRSFADSYRTPRVWSRIIGPTNSRITINISPGEFTQ